MAAVDEAHIRHNDIDARPRGLSRLSSVGPALYENCLKHAIVACECDILQTHPDPPGVRSRLSNSDLHCSHTLLPALTRWLYLWKEEDGGRVEYHLTAVNVAKEEVFLTLPLSGLQRRELTYNQKTDFWHEVTVYRDRNRPQKLVFNLKSSPETKTFNNCLRQVIEEISHWQKKGETRQADDSQFGNYIILQAVPANAPVISPMASLSSSTLPRLLGAEASSMAVGDLPSAIARPQEKLPSKVVKQFSEELAAAIQAGNVSKAQQLAAMLAQGHARLTVSFDPDAHDNRPSEQEISVTVHVEDRESAGLALSDVKVRPTDSILDLKRTFLGKYGFPLEVQKWIIGNRIPNDEETLSRCGVHSSGSTLYLYLLSARAANITRDDYRRQWQGHTPGGPHRVASRPKSGDYESLCMPFAPPATQGPQSSGQGHGQVQSSSTSSAARQQSQLSTSGSANSLPTPSLGLSDLRSTDPGVSTQNLSEHTSGQRAPEVRQGQGQGEDLLPGVGEPLAASSGVERFLLQGVQTGPPPQEQQSMLGWQCITCTLINQPTRPGCEACGSPRPVDYEVPSEYVVSEEERQRLEREQHLEALMQQASGHGWVQGQEQGGTSLLPLPTTSELGNNRPLTAEQLDLILRFNDAIQQHLSTSGTANQGAVAGGVQQGVNSQVLPSGLRQPVQNVELGEEEPDMLLGWVSGDENDHLSA